MKPKHHKTVRCSRHKRQNQGHGHAHHHHHVPIESSYNPLQINIDADDLEPLTEAFDLKCTTKGPWDQSKKKSAFNKLDSNDDDEAETDRFNALFQTVRERRETLVERLKIYNNLFKFHKSIKEDQVYLYRKLQDMDEKYLRNTAAILRLGFCPCLVHQQTSPVGDLLMKIHRKLRVWDKKSEDLCEILKERSTEKTTAAVLQILKICDKSKMGDLDLTDISLPEIVWDLGNPFLENLNLPKVTEDWKNVRQEARESLCKAEISFQEICLEFGITRGPEQTPSSTSVTRQFIYENVCMTADNSDEISNNEQPANKDDEVEDGSGADTPSSKVSSSFF